MSSRTSVAVVIPVRDGDTLALCLAALLGGHRAPDELVVVDDGSTPPIAPESLPTGVRLIRRAAAGPGAARNAGAAATTAELLVFVDADVEVKEDTIGRLEAIYTSSGKAALQCVYDVDCPVASVPARVHNTLQRRNLLSVGDTSRQGEPHRNEPHRNEPHRDEPHRDEPHRLRGLSSFCVAIARHAFVAAGGFDERVRRATIEDDNLGLALTGLGYDVWVLPDLTVRHHSRPTAARLLRRMAAMADDRVATGALFNTVRSLSSGRTHHRPDFLAAVVMVGLAPFAPPCAGVLLLASLGVQWRALAALVAEHGVSTAILGAPLLIGLAGAAAVGSARGLTRRLGRPCRISKELSWEP